MQQKTNMQQVFAVTDVDQSVGAITYCKLTADISIEELREQWIARGFDVSLLPSLPTAENVLRRALESVRTGLRVLLRPLAGKHGFALVAEHVNEDKLDYDTHAMLRARIEHDSNNPETGYLVVTPSNHPHADLIRQRYNELQKTISPGAFGSSWLWRILAPRCYAVTLRESGGMYFIPRANIEQWNAWVQVIEDTCPGVKIYRLPAVSAAEAITAIMDAVRGEAESAVKAINDELGRTGTDALGKRALENRKSRTEAVRNKVQHYENLFAIKLDDLRSQLDSLNTEITGALLMLAPEDDDL